MATPTPPVVRHDDLDELRRRKIAVPAVFARGAWLQLALGQHTSDLGPTTTQLLLWLPVRADDAAATEPATPTWREVEAVIGERRAASSRTVATAAAVLWANGPAPALTTAGDQYSVHGAELLTGSAFGNIFWKPGWALATSAGLLVSLVSG